MKPSNEQVHRYLDGEMKPDELKAFEARLAGDTELREEVEELTRLRTTIRAHSPFDPDKDEVPHADFFNVHLVRQIEQEQRLGQRVPAESPASGGLLGWLRLPWVVAAGATALAVFSLVRVDVGDGHADGRSAVVSTYAPDSSVKSRVYFSEEAGATVIELSGIEEIPGERLVSGRALRSHEPGQGLAVTLRDASGRAVMALLPDLENGGPRFRSLDFDDQG